MRAVRDSAAKSVFDLRLLAEVAKTKARTPPMTTDKQLLPCPFCGGAPERISIGTVACRGLIDGREIHNTISMHPSKWNNRMEAVRPPVGEEVVLRVRDAIRRVKEERHAPITGDEELEARAAIIAMQSNG
jgi:hypothetical protein